MLQEPSEIHNAVVGYFFSPMIYFSAQRPGRLGSVIPFTNSLTRFCESSLPAEQLLALPHPQSYCSANIPTPLIPFLFSLVFLTFPVYQVLNLLMKTRIMACSSSHRYSKRLLFLTHSLERIYLFSMKIFSFVIILISHHFAKRDFYCT